MIFVPATALRLSHRDLVFPKGSDAGISSFEVIFNFGILTTGVLLASSSSKSSESGALSIRRLRGNFGVDFTADGKVESFAACDLRRNNLFQITTLLS